MPRIDRVLCRALSAFVLSMFVLAVPAHAAGIICGTIRDAVTNAPVARAGIFLRTPSGAYTGLNTATDGAGHYCLGGILPGTYTVEVRVDDHVAAYRTGVVVVDATSGVDMMIAPPPAWLAPPAPNPAVRGTRVAFTLAVAGEVRVSVFDARGRLVMGWEPRALPAGEHAFDWDLRESGGAVVPAGLYFVQLEALGARLTRRITCLRGTP